MLLWFAGLSFVLVWLVFSSPALDYRLVMAGSLLPLVELPFGEPRVLHSLAAAVLVLAVVMALTRDRRLARRQWLGVPIGLFLHLVLDGVWADTDAFWWPFTGTEFSDARLPELGRGGWNVVLEVAGAAALWWCWRGFGFDDASRRSAFLRNGQLPRDVIR